MILADTTLTRKSTAMDIAMDLVAEVDQDAMLATDGSIEGLMTSLSMRPGRPSVFLRDEFSGLLEAMNKKDYYAGMAETLTKLYDGKPQKRVLRKETIEVRDPRLIIFAGGIKNKVASILTHEQVSSGFMPRFVFITAESDITKLKPLGPPTDWTDNGRSTILNRLLDLSSHYRQTVLTEAPGLKGHKVEVPRTYLAQLTPDAWLRYNLLESTLVQEGLKQEALADILTPTYDRLAKSILKAAVLLAATETTEDDIEVDVDHILRAIAYGEQWKMFADDVISKVGITSDEQMLAKVLKTISQAPDGTTRSRIMQWHHLDSREASRVLDTLDQRGLIVRRKNGRTETLFPTVIGAANG